MAPSRFAPNAVSDDPTSRKRCAKIRFATKTGRNATAAAAANLGSTPRVRSELGRISHAMSRASIKAT